MAELQVVLEAQDRASAQLRQVGQEVARLGRTVATVGAGLGAGVAGGVAAAAAAFSLLQGAAEAAQRAVVAVTDQLREGFAANVELERATIAFRRYTGSAEDAAAIIADLRREAAASPFNDQEVIAAGRALIGFAQGSRDQLLELVRVAERLAVLDPTQGIVGGVRALQEALGGQFRSFSERFEIPMTMIQRWRDEGLPALEVVKRGLEFRGIDAGAIEAYGRSVEGLLSTLQSFAAELRQLATSGAFRAAGQAFAHLVAVMNRFGDELRAAAQAIGQVFVELGARVLAGLAPLVRLLDAVLPGVGSAILEEFARPLEVAGDAAERARPQLEALAEATDLQRVTRRLADVGVAAAELQIDAERLRRAYQDQLAPLERQRDLLRNSADLQRVQNALATNRATTERLRLEREVQALQRAARGREDPNAPDLTPRQQAIALALQERRLRLEELGLTEQQRPAVQALDQQIEGLRRAQADALAPLERSLALRREEADLLQIERTRLQAAAEQAQQTAGAFGAAWEAAKGPDAAAQAANKASIGARADELAKEWLDRFEKWVDANGGNAWTAIARSLTLWTLETGIPVAVRIGGQIAAGIFAGVWAAWERYLAQNPLLDALLAGSPILQGLRPQTWRFATDPLTAEEAQAAAGRAVQSVTVNVGGVQVGGEEDAAYAARLRQALTEFLQQFVLTNAAVDPGASGRLQGAGR